jgi:K+-sensing histidine kinase KdpD
MNPPNAVRCDCGYDFVARTIAEQYNLDNKRTKNRWRRSVTQYMLSCFIGTVCVLALLWLGLHFHFSPPAIVMMFLLGPLFVLGFAEPRGGTGVAIFAAISIGFDVLYYGAVVLSIWEGASKLKKKWVHGRDRSRQTADRNA